MVAADSRAGRFEQAGYLTGQNILIDGGAFPGAF